MSELTDKIFTEKYRPQTLDELVLENKEKLSKYLETPEKLPSFIFYSTKPGTGKTSCAKVIIRTLDCDNIIINSSDERGIDTIREKVTRFAMGLSSNTSKRCIFLDEADGLTPQAQNSLRNLMETYSDNCFFIFSCNDVNKIIEPIRSRCTEINFENPDPEEVLSKIDDIMSIENIKLPSKYFMGDLVNHFYPDIRSMIKTLEELKLTGKASIAATEDFEMFLDAITRKDMNYIVKAVYSSNLDIMAWNRWYFKKVFENSEKLEINQCIAIADLLADTEKNWNMGANLEIVFISNVFKLTRIL